MKKEILFNFDEAVLQLNEAIERGEGNPDFYHPTKLAEDETVEEYKHMLYSENYQKVIERLAHYTGQNPEELGNYPITSEVVKLLQKILRIESSHKDRLEKLAVKMVLNLPECAPIKEAIEDGVIKIDAKLSSGELQNAVTDLEAQEREAEQTDEEGNPVVEGDDLTDEEKTNIALAMDIMGAEEIKQRRDFADILRYGEAFNHLYSYNLVRDQLDAINPELAGMYGIVSAIVQVLYYFSPPGIEGQVAKNPGSALGSAEAQPEGREGEEGIYTIKARAMTFSFLVHEIIKGIVQYVGLTDETRNAEKLGSLEGETRKARFAQALVNKIIAMIPQPFAKHKYYIYQQLLQLPSNEIEEVKAAGGRGRAIINNIIKEMCAEFNLDPKTGEEKEEEYEDVEPEENYEDEDQGEGEGAF
jgi:hypothetical protein